MEIRILGPTEAIVDGRAARLAGAKQRAVLVMLALEAPRAVTAERLVEGLWGEAPPPSAGKMLQVYVSQLRKALTGDGGSAIVTRGRGYELQIAPDAVDAQRFARLVGEATRAAELGAPDDVARAALALWRGAPLIDVADEPFAAPEIRRLEELRVTALELEIDADLRAGRQREVVGRLDRLIAEHPLRERLHAQRMLALYRAGRQADALAAYRVARRTLVEEIGTEPGPELRRLHEAVLRQDPALEPAEAQALPPELDVESTLLIGRSPELAWLRTAWRDAHAGAGRLVVLAGPQGIGKTRLAAELAGELRCQGAHVRYAGAAGPPGAATAALEATLAARRPALAVIDDVDRLEPAALDALQAAHERLRARRVLVLATCRDGDRARGLEQLAGSAWVARLATLAADDVEHIARLYDDAAEVPIARLLAASEGVPLRVHQQAAEWARGIAADRLEVVAERAAAGRRGLRAVEAELAGSVVDLQAVRERARRHAPASALVVCPFKGLAPFDRDDAPYFFGRERLVAELVALLVGTPLVGIVGPSGSGKSSVMRAGVLPELAGGVLPGSAAWPQVLVRPGAQPPRALARALEPLAADGAEPLLAVVDDALAGVPAPGRLIVAVDQFEELFTACADPGARAEFVDALVRLAADSARAAVMVAVRSDFYGRFGAYPELTRLLGAGHVLVGAMRRDELRRAIELPAERAGLTIEQALVETLVADVADAPGGLPLLSAALLELWQRREGRRLRLEAYEQHGGVRGAVARLAEAAYGRLPEPERVVARAVLLRLAASEEGAAVRRRVPRDEFEPDAENVIAVLAGQRLLTVDAGSVEVSHETLMREWPRLRAWIEEDAEGRRLHAHLIEAARVWDAGGRDPADLYRGGRLAAAADWADVNSERLNAVETEFVAESRAAGRQEVERARRSVRRLRGLAAGVAVLLVLARRGRSRGARPARSGARAGHTRGGRAAGRPGARAGPARPVAAARAPGPCAAAVDAERRQPASDAAPQPGSDQDPPRRRRQPDGARHRSRRTDARGRRRPRDAALPRSAQRRAAGPRV